jgi:hemoglobin/transferrin/lactoferrin receptor protein
MMMRPALFASVSVLVLAGGAVAQEGSPSTIPLDDITVTATRTENRAVDTLAPVSVRNRDEIQRQAPQRIGSVISGMPGVTTQENPNDPATSINIRGLQDFGRVAVTIDGARQNFQRSGHNANGAFFLDPAFVRTIDITRGPVANVYGSGAIGGVASFETVDPRDILSPGQKLAAQLGFTGVVGGRQNGVFGHAIGAIRPTHWASGLVGVSFRNLNAYKDGGGFNIADSGQELVSGIGKIVLTPGDGHTIKLSGQLQQYEFANGLGTPAAPRRSNEVKTSNLVARYSFSRPDNDWLNLNASGYRTTTDTDQVRISGNPAQIGQSRFFRIETIGLDINNTSRLQLGPAKLALTYGLDAFQDRVRTFDPFGNGDESTPRGERSVYGGFLQKHLNWGRFDLITGLRYDSYELSGGNNKSNGQRFSPKITLGFTPIEGLQPYITYAEGYRAPSITETLVAGPHPIPASFLFIPNPGLKPEVGKTIEAGLNIKYDNVLQTGDRFRGKISVFQNNVTNFIEGVYRDPGAPCGSGVPNACADATFRYENVARARLQGIEGEFAYDTKRWFASIAGSITRGDNRTNGQPLESVYPDRISLGGGVRFLNEKLVFGGRVTFVAEQRRLPAASLAANASKAYALVDANLSYEITKDTRFFLIGENLGDVRYRRYRDGDRSPGLVTKVGLTSRFGM